MKLFLLEYDGNSYGTVDSREFDSKIEIKNKQIFHKEWKN